MNKEVLNRQIKEKARLIDIALDNYLPTEETDPEIIHQAMRYICRR